VTELLNLTVTQWEADRELQPLFLGTVKE